MISGELVDLTLEKDEDFKKLLRQPQIEIMRRVVDAQVKHHQVKGLKEALQADPTNDKLIGLNAALLRAQRYQHFLDVLDELQKHQGPFQTIKLS